MAKQEVKQEERPSGETSEAIQTHSGEERSETIDAPRTRRVLDVGGTPALQPVDGRGGDTVENLQEGLHQEQLIQLLEQFTDHVEDLDGVFAATGMKILLVEFACQDDSELSKAAEQRGWETLRLTRATYDLRTKTAIEQVVNLLNDKIHQGYVIV